VLISNVDYPAFLVTGKERSMMFNMEKYHWSNVSYVSFMLVITQDSTSSDYGRYNQALW